MLLRMLLLLCLPQRCPGTLADQGSGNCGLCRASAARVSLPGQALALPGARPTFAFLSLSCALLTRLSRSLLKLEISCSRACVMSGDRSRGGRRRVTEGS